MKAIDNIIKRLMEGAALTPDETKIIGYILNECRAIELAEKKGEKITVEMSLDRYKWYLKNAFDIKGNPKQEDLKIFKPFKPIGT